MSMSTLSFISSNHPDLSSNQSNGPNQRDKLTKQIVINVNIDSNPIKLTYSIVKMVDKQYMLNDIVDIIQLLLWLIFPFILINQAIQSNRTIQYR